MVKNIILLFIGFLFSLHVAAQNFEIIQLYYNKDSFKLNNQQRHLMDSVVENFSNRRILIDGHADYSGSENNNELISTKRANATLRYLVDRGFPETQVIHSIGVGQTAESLSGKRIVKENTLDRRVDIFIAKGPIVISKLKEVSLPAIQNIAHNPPYKNVTRIDYKKLKVGDNIALQNISFLPGSDTIRPESYNELNNLFELLNINPTLKICLEGHVCCCFYPDGYLEETPNWDLSVSRALKVKTLLEEKGIDAERLTYKGFGRTRPIFEQETSIQQEQINRRVEIRIIEK